MAKKINLAIIGCGGMARHHLRNILRQTDDTEVVGLCEPSSEMLKATHMIFEEYNLPIPNNYIDYKDLLSDHGLELDCAFIVTPHIFHHEQTIACMEAGLDVLLEKPMVMNAVEAQDLIAVQKRTGRLLVVAFPGSLSPQIRTAVKMINSGELGKIISISATVWQNWGSGTINTWRQKLELSGGGFLFDTGAHMLNTVVDLADEEFSDIAAWLDNNNRPVETTGVVIGRLKSGTMVTLHACGETIKSCASDLRVFGTNAILRTGIWGERLEIQREGDGELAPVKVPESMGVWEQFVAVRNKSIDNPCPPEVGLRMAHLYDAIKESANSGGKPTSI